MLREGLATEFPFASRALASIRRPRVAREGPVWSAISGFGAAWLIGSSGQVVAMVIRIAGFRDPASWASGAFAIAGAALGVAVAVRAGGRRGLVWYAIGLAAIALLTLATQLPGYLDICARAVVECSPLKLALPHVYTLAGLLISVVAIPFVKSGATGANPVLSGAGAFILVEPAAIALWRLTSFLPADPSAGLALGLGFVGLGMLAAGIVIRIRSTGTRSIIVLGAIVTALLLGQQGPFLWDIARGAYVVTSPVNLYSVLVGPAELGALVVGWRIPIRR